MSNIYKESISQSPSPGTSCKRKSCTPSDEVDPKRIILEASDDNELPDVSLSHFNEGNYYCKGGLAHTLHGNIYQLKLLMLFLKRALREGYEFNLGTEVEDAEKFDDIVFKYKSKCVSGNTKVCAVQVKSRQNESEVITVNDLLKSYNSSENDFSLQKYFISLRKIQKNPNFQEYELNDFVIYTNINFADLGTITLDEYKGCDDIFQVTKSGKSTKRFRLNVPKEHALYDALKNTSDFHILVHTLKDHIIKNKKIQRKDIFKLYHHILSEKLFEIVIKEVQNAKGKKCFKRFFKFRADFLDGSNLTEEVYNFRNELYLAIQSEKGNIYWENLSHKEFSISEDFGKVFGSQTYSIGFPNDDVKDADIKEFFEKHLVFAVNQPNVDELGKIITDEMGKSSQFNLLNAGLVTDSFQSKMLDWFKEKRKEKGREGVWLNAHSGQTFLNSIEKEVSGLVSLGISIAHPEELAKLGIMTTTISVVDDLHAFLLQTSKNILHIVAEGETLLSSINVYNALEVLKNQNEFVQFKREDSYVFVNLSTLLLEKIRDYITNAFESRNNYQLMIIDCKTAGETREIFKLYTKLSDVLAKTNKKIIFIADENHILIDLFEKNEKVIIKNSITFSDLTEQSKENLLHKNVEFQGQKISINKLIDKSDENANEIINEQVIIKLLKGDDIKINCSLQDLGDVNDYYIKRMFRRVILSKENFISYLENNGSQSDLFVISGTDTIISHQNVVKISDKRFAECKFLELCEKNKDSNIHWLEYDSKSLIWYKSYGSVSNIMQCRNSETIQCSKKINLTEEHEFVHDERCHRLVIISDIAGMGKSTVLTNLSMELIKVLYSPWIIRIDLNKHTTALKLYEKQKLMNKNKMELLDFLFVDLRVIKFESILQEKLFRNNFCKYGNVVFLIDGFDEIYPYYKEIVIELLQALKRSNIKKMFVTTRPNVKIELEKVLGTFSRVMEPLTKEEQHEFLTNFWQKKLKVNNIDHNLINRLKIYVDSVIDHVSMSTNSKEREFIGIPLQTMLLAEVFQNNQKETSSKWQGCQEFLLSDRYKPKLPTSFALLDLYKHFIRRKFNNFYLESKKGRDLTKGGEEKDAANKFETFEQKCFTLALNALFSEEKLEYLLSPSKKEELKILIDEFKINEHNEGMIDRLIDDKPQFIHRTFAEYFASFPIAEKMLVDAAATLHCIDSALINFSPIFINKLIEHLDGKQEIICSNLNMPLMHYVITKDCSNFIKCLFESDFMKWPSKLDISGKTPLHYAVDLGLLKVADKLLGYANDIHEKVILKHGSFKNPDYMNSKLVKFVNIPDNSGKTALHYALQNDYLDFAFKLLLKGASIDTLTDDEVDKLMTKMFNICQNASIFNNSILAAYANQDNKYRPIEEKLLLKSPSVFKTLCIKDQSRILSYFFVHGRVKIIDTLLSTITDLEQRKRILNNDDNGYTPLDRVNESDHLSDEERLQITQYLIDHGSINTQHGNSSDDWVAKVLFAACKNGSLNTIKKFIFNENHVNNNYNTQIYEACCWNQFNIVKYLVENHIQYLTDSAGNTPLHSACDSKANLKIIKFLLEYYDINAENNKGETPLFMCLFGRGPLKVIKYLFDRGSDINKEDACGNTPLSYAIDKNRDDIVQYLLGKGACISNRASQLTRNKVLLFSDQYNVNMVDVNGYPNLHSAIISRNFEWAKFLIRHGADINKVDKEEKTPLHWACTERNTDIVELLLQYGAIFDIKDKNNNVPRDLLGTKKKEGSFESKICWLLKVLDALFSTQYFTKVLNSKLLAKSNDLVDWGPYKRGIPDAWDSDNPMLFILNARNSKGQTLFHLAALDEDATGIMTIKKFNCDYLKRKRESLLIPRYRDYQALSINTIDCHGNTPLHLAAQKGNYEVVSILLKSGAVFNKINMYSETPEQLATRHKHEEVVQLIVLIREIFVSVEENHILAVVNFIDEYPYYTGAKNVAGKTLLHVAASLGQLVIVQFLLGYLEFCHVDLLEAVDDNKNTPLHCAAQNDKIEIVKLLLAYGANYDARNSQNKKPFDLVPNQSHNLLELFRIIDTLFDGIHSDNPEMIITNYKMMSKNNQMDFKSVVNVQDEEKNTLLHYAVQSCEYGIVELLLENGAYYDVKNKDECTAIRLNCDQAITTLLKALEKLFENVGDVYRNQEVSIKIMTSVRDHTHKGLLHYAIKSCLYEIVNFLVERGAIVDWTAIKCVSVKRGSTDHEFLEMVKYLFDSFDVDETNYKGETTLLVAVNNNSNLDIIKYLVEKESDVNHEDVFGNTPLSQAIKSDNKDVIAYLLSKNAKVSERAPQAVKDMYAVLMKCEN